MDVEQSVAAAVDEPRAENAHEAREADDLDAGPGQRPIKLGLETFPVAKLTVINDARRDSGSPCAGEAESVGAIAEDQGQLNRRGRVRVPVDQRLQVGAASRDQDRDAALGHAVSSPVNSTRGRPEAAAMVPIVCTVSPAATSAARTASTWPRSTTNSIPIPQLK